MFVPTPWEQETYRGPRAASFFQDTCVPRSGKDRWSTQSSPLGFLGLQHSSFSYRDVDFCVSFTGQRRSWGKQTSSHSFDFLRAVTRKHYCDLRNFRQRWWEAKCGVKGESALPLLRRERGWRAARGSARAGPGGGGRLVCGASRVTVTGKGSECKPHCGGRTENQNSSRAGHGSQITAERRWRINTS